jgi:hypothetical protein
VLGDVALIHHVDQATYHHEDQRFFVCWAFCHNPSQIPQFMFLILIDRHADPRLDGHLQISRSHTIKQGHTFRLLIHIDSIEDLPFIIALLSSFVQKEECNSGSLGGPPVSWMGIWMLKMLEWRLDSVGLQMGSSAALGVMMM